MTTSQILGVGMLQDDDIYHNYTLGKCVQNVDWNDANDYIEYNDELYCKILLKILITTT